MFKKYHCVKQHDLTDCGAACLATIALHYDLKIPISKIRESAGTDSFGTTVFGMLKASRELGFKSKAVRMTNLELVSKKLILPAIAHVVVREKYLHYMVINEISNDKIIVSDPDKGVVTYTKDEFMKIWTGVIIMLKPQQLLKVDEKNPNVLMKFLKIILDQKALLINVVLASTIITIFGMLSGFYFKVLMDNILPNSLSKSLVIVSIGVIALEIFKVILGYFRSLELTYLSQNIDITILLGYYRHVIKLPLNFFSSRKVGEILSRFDDASNIKDILSQAILTIFIDLPMAIFGGIVLYLQSSELFIVTFIPIVLYIVLGILFKDIIRKQNRDYMEKNAEVNSYIIQTLHGIETIKGFSGEVAVEEETEKKFARFINSVIKFSFTMNRFNSLKSAVDTIFSTGIIWYGATLVLNGNISIGLLLSFNALLAYFIGPVQRIINIQPEIQKAMVAAERLEEILVLEVEQSDEKYTRLLLDNIKGDISFENINFRYGTRKKVLENFNLSINAGSRVAIVGESGSGKTTIAKLLMSFYRTEDGNIKIDDKNIEDIDIESLRSKIAYVSQESFFFADTIENNLTFSNPELTYEEMIKVCKYFQIHDYINELPLRYNTKLDENGGNLSSGQKQRLALARALIRKPDILILDEATSNLDSVTERIIEETLSKYYNDITTIIISHRLGMVRLCDKIYVFKKGKITEDGTHTELLSNNGEYKKLWDKQIPI